MLEHKPQSIFESARAVLEGSQVQLEEINKSDEVKNESTNLEEDELTEAISPQIKKIRDLVEKLPTTDIKGFLDELASVFEKKSDDEKDSVDLKNVYKRVFKHIDNAYIAVAKAPLDK